jgi:hypothetical protein
MDRELFGFLSGVLTLCLYAEYARSVLRSRDTVRPVSPSRTSNFIWLCEDCVMLPAQVLRGATASLWLIGTGTLGVLTIFVLSIPYGTDLIRRTGRKHARRDRYRLDVQVGDIALLACVGGTLMAWGLTSSPGLAIVLIVAVDWAGGMVTIRKAYRKPGSEPARAWVLCGLGACAGLLSIGTGPVVLYVYPASEVVMATCVLAVSFLGTRRMADRVRAARN